MSERNIERTNVTTLTFRAESFRKIPNPYKDDANSIPQMYTAICDVKAIPAQLLDWMETNPRKQNIRNGVSKKIIKSLTTRGSDFHLLNRGILISAADVRFNNYDNMMSIDFSDPNVHGDVDGGHTLRIILENADVLEDGQQFVKIEILTGVESIYEDLAEARNTSTQVQDKSIANLRDYFDMIKEVISTEEFSDRVYFMENDDGDIDVGEILALLNLFNIDDYKGNDSFPIVSFSSRKRCIDTYINMYQKYEDAPENPYVKMKPIMLDIFKLYDRLERKIADYYRQMTPGGKYGSIKGVVIPKEGSVQALTKFYHHDRGYVTPNGFLFPILGSLRALLEERDGVYCWKKNPFEILDKVGPELVTTTIDRHRTLGNNPNAVGKDGGNWKLLYMRVMMEALMP